MPTIPLPVGHLPDHTTVEDALVEAKSYPNSWVFVCPGTYSLPSPQVVDFRLNGLIGLGGAAVTTLEYDGSSSAPMFGIFDVARVEGFTLDGLWGTAPHPDVAAMVVASILGVSPPVDFTVVVQHNVFLHFSSARATVRVEDRGGPPFTLVFTNNIVQDSQVGLLVSPTGFAPAVIACDALDDDAEFANNVISGNVTYVDPLARGSTGFWLWPQTPTSACRGNYNNNIIVGNVASEGLSGPPESIESTPSGLLPMGAVSHNTSHSNTCLTVPGSFNYSDSNDNEDRDPIFSTPGSFGLSTVSPERDSGHPASRYDDIDGSQNDRGCYGGPFGDW